jgi:hypothetical protein
VGRRAELEGPHQVAEALGDIRLRDARAVKAFSCISGVLMRMEPPPSSVR